MADKGEGTGLLAASEPSNNNTTYGEGTNGSTHLENGKKSKDKNKRLQRNPSLDKV